MNDNVTTIREPEPRRLPAERCNRCRFWAEDMKDRDPNDEDWGFGSCRRRPPVLVEPIVKALMPELRYGQQTDPDMTPLELIAASRFPATHSVDWCGEYDSRDSFRGSPC